jgi:hypothetical protein
MVDHNHGQVELLVDEKAAQRQIQAEDQSIEEERR